MQLIQASTTLDSTLAMQMKFEQTLDGEIKYKLANLIAQELMDSNQFIIYTEFDPYSSQTHFRVNIGVTYK